MPNTIDERIIDKGKIEVCIPTSIYSPIKLKNSTFKILKNSLASSVQNKFNFNEGEQFSIITIRGLGATEIQNQIDQLMLWFGSFESEIKNFDKELFKRE